MAIFCHSPPERSTPLLKRRPSAARNRAASGDDGVGGAAVGGLSNPVAVPRRLDPTDGDILGGGKMEADEILEDHADALAQVVEVVVAQVAAVEQDAAFVGS